VPDQGSARREQSDQVPQSEVSPESGGGSVLGKSAHLAECEASCKERFIASTTDLGGCPQSCLGTTARTETLFNAIKLALDTENGDILLH